MCRHFLCTSPSHLLIGLPFNLSGWPRLYHSHGSPAKCLEVSLHILVQGDHEQCLAISPPHDPLHDPSHRAALTDFE